MPTPQEKSAELRRAALEYHEFPTPGKVAIAATKQMTNQHDLALAYSPGVAAAGEVDDHRPHRAAGIGHPARRVLHLGASHAQPGLVHQHRGVEQGVAPAVAQSRTGHALQ